ncbi:hypothetical protein ACFQO4_06355 [Saliphagus sp. GCM10025334]
MSQPLTLRETIPLVLLYESEDYRIEGRTRFQKLVFLVQEQIDRDLYQFVPYDYGPFSKILLDDLERLEDLGLVEINLKELYRGGERYDHQLLPTGVKSVRNLLENSENPAVIEIHEAAQEAIRQWEDKSMWDLLDHIYENHQQYKERSVLY